MAGARKWTDGSWVEGERDVSIGDFHSVQLEHLSISTIKNFGAVHAKIVASRDGSYTWLNAADEFELWPVSLSSFDCFRCGSFADLLSFSYSSSQISSELPSLSRSSPHALAPNHQRHPHASNPRLHPVSSFFPSFSSSLHHHVAKLTPLS